MAFELPAAGETRDIPGHPSMSSSTRHRSLVYVTPVGYRSIPKLPFSVCQAFHRGLDAKCEGMRP